MERTYELWILGYDKNHFATDFCEQVGEAKTGEEGRNELCKIAASLTPDEIKRQFAEKLSETKTVEVCVQVEELDYENNEEETNIYWEESYDLPGATKHIEIMWDDLTPEKQKEILEILGDNNNWDICPIAVIDVEEED